MRKLLKKWAGVVIIAVGMIFATLVGVAQADAPIDDATLWSNIKSQLVSAGWTPPAPPPPTGPLKDAWIYPDAPNVPAELADGRQIYALKAEFLKVNDNGSISQINATTALPNGYSAGNVALYKQHSQEQYITVSGTTAGTDIAMDNPATITAIVDLTESTGFTGAELDWEGYGAWSTSYYDQYKAFVTNLDTALAAKGKKLIVVGPAIWNATSQGWYKWKYEELTPLVDQAVMMVYDAQYDNGVGTSIQPHQWALDCYAWLVAKSGTKGTAGVPSYGYRGPVNTYNVTVGSSTSMQKANPTRNADGELTKTVTGTFYDWSDVQTMQARLSRVETAGIGRISVWSLGNNPWFE